MKKTLSVSILILFIFSSLSYAAQDKRPMTVDDALNMVRVGNVMMSPDGEWIFFSKSELDWEKNKRKSRFYMVPASGGEAFQYISEAGGSSFRFSPNGKYLSFKRTIDKKSQLFILPTSGGEGIQLTKHKTSVADYKWTPDSSRIFFTADVARSAEEEKKFKAGYDSILVDEGPNGQKRGSWKHFWAIDIKTKKETEITQENLIPGSFDISPCSNKIVFTASYSNRRNDGYKEEIYLFSLIEKKLIRLTQNNAPENSPVWAPDGNHIAYIAADNQEWLNRNGKIWLLDPETKKSRLLSGKFSGSMRRLFWSQDNRSIWFNGQQKTNTNLYKILVADGSYTQITHFKGTLQIGSFSQDRTRMAYTFNDFDSPSDVYSAAVNNFEPVRLTKANPWIEEKLQLASLKVISWQSKKNFKIEGLLHFPAEYKKGTAIPMILNIHGGPAGCFTNSFRASYHIYAGLGYASLSPNVRGSSGYTDVLREGNSIQGGDGIGKGDYWDLMNGIDYVIKQGYADPDRLALRGWSYGGILGGWTITQTDRFKAASIGAGVYDWTSEYGPGFNHDVRLWHIGGTPWDNPEAYRQQSTFTYVKNIQTPTLLIHGINDPTDTEAQSMLLFAAIKDIGKTPVRYLRVPREPHGFREPRHQRTRDIEEIKWMEKYVKGLDWKAWERPEKKPEDKKEDKK